MYQDSAHIQLVGFTAEDASAIKSVAPLEALRFTFNESDGIDPVAIAAADAIFLRVEDSASSAVSEALRAKSPKARLILVAPHGILEALGDEAEAIDDIWFGPLQGAELA